MSVQSPARSRWRDDPADRPELPLAARRTMIAMVSALSHARRALIGPPGWRFFSFWLALAITNLGTWAGVVALQLQCHDAGPGAQIRDGKGEPEREEPPAGRPDQCPACVRQCAHHRDHRTPRRERQLWS